MPLKDHADIEITAFAWVPPFAHGLVKDLRVRWALEEAGLDYRVRLIGPDRPQNYRLDQPFDQVPCFTDGKVRIFETGAILQYIGEQCDILLPTDAQGRYRAIQWTCAALSSIEPFVQHRALLEGLWADEPWAAGAKPIAERQSSTRLQQLSEWLGDKTWLEGDRFTIGDLMMVTVLRIADRRQLLTPHPTLAAYLSRGEARPAFQQALADQLATFRANEPQGVAA